MKIQFLFRCLATFALCLPLFSRGANADNRTFTLDQVVGILSFQQPADKTNSPDAIKTNILSFFPKHLTNEPFTIAQVKQLQHDFPTLYPVKQEESSTPKSEPFLGLKIRQDYNDVVQAEDPTVGAPKKGRNQLTGAAFSFSRDFLAHADTWSVQGSLIRPFILYDHTENKDTNGIVFSDPPKVRAIYLIPSISLYKIDSKTAPKTDVDDLTFRLGLSVRSDWVKECLISEFEARIYAAYDTDTSFKASTVAGQFDLEPRFSGNSGATRSAIGFQRSLVPYTGGDDKTNTSQFVYTLRMYGHGEFGRVNAAGGNTSVQTGDFFRFGPVMKLEFQPCFLARLLRLDPQALTFQASYSYLARVNGIDPGHDSYYTAGLDWSLIKGDAQAQKISLKILYENGGLDLTKAVVDRFTIGLGVTF